MLSEEVGTHIESYLDIQKQNINGVTYQSINSEIKSLSSSITKLEVLDEKWDGKNYWIKAKVRINEKRTVELLLTAIKSKSNEKDIKRLNKILATQKQQLNSQNSQVSEMNKKLVSQEIINEARKSEVANMKSQLVKYQQKEIEQKKEISEHSQAIERIKNQVTQVKSRIQQENEKACLMEIGMTKKDVANTIGEPSVVNDIHGYGIYCSSEKYKPFNDECRQWFYGNITLTFEVNGLLNNKYGCR
jgi:chromosome segregation ATPase